jgi:hypothetical protein
VRLLRAFSVLLLAAAAAHAAATSYDMGAAGVLAVDLPSGWTLTRQGPNALGGAAFRIDPPAGTQLVLLMTPTSLPQGHDGEPAAKRLAGEVAEHFAPTAMESSLPIQTLKGPATRGYFVSATDKNVTNPSTEEFKHVDQGAVSLGSVLVSFTLLTNVPDGPEREQGLAIIRELKISPAKASAPPKP